jgi:hypothetical protein
MEAIGELPSTEELEKLAQRLFSEDDINTDTLMARGAISELIALRNAIEHVIETCTDLKTVAYLRDMMDKTKQ